MFKIYFNKVFGLGFAFDITHIVSFDKPEKRCKYIHIKLYILNILVNISFRVTPWKNWTPCHKVEITNEDYLAKVCNCPICKKHYGS